MDSGSLLEGRQGVLLLLEGGLRILEGHLLLLEGLALFPKGSGERDNSHLLVEELDLLLLERCSEAPQLGALCLGFPSLLLECRPEALQLGRLCLGLPSLLLCCGPLDVPLTGSPRQTLLQRLLTRSQIRHFSIGLDVLEH